MFRNTQRLSCAVVSNAPTLVSMEITRGDRVEVVNALGQHRERIALSSVMQGHDFLVVWVCKPEEWEAARREGREPQGMPYPREDVRAVARA
jgi:hypothetical protein